MDSAITNSLTTSINWSSLSCLTLIKLCFPPPVFSLAGVTGLATDSAGFFATSVVAFSASLTAVVGLAASSIATSGASSWPGALFKNS